LSQAVALAVSAGVVVLVGTGAAATGAVAARAEEVAAAAEVAPATVEAATVMPVAHSPGTP
jgi:hypothetical protein